MLSAYAELHCRSNFSFLNGASHPEELVQRAHALGYSALAITDECSLAGVVRAHTEARRLGLHLVIGAEMQLHQPAAQGEAPQPHARLLLHAQGRRGYGNLSQWITACRRRAGKGRYLAHPSDLEGRLPHLPHLAGLPDCLALLLPPAVLDTPPRFESLFAQAQWLQAWFGADRCGLALPLLHRRHDDELIEVVQAVAAATGLPIVATGEVLMHSRARKPLQDVLTATRLAQPVAACGTALEGNAEAHLRSRQRLQGLYPPAWLAASVAWAGRCTFSLSELRYEYPKEVVPEGHTPSSWLAERTRQGAARRYPEGVPPRIADQLRHELSLIAQLAYEPYFLTVADVVQWARGRGILCQGRGSAANSAVCFCLGITEVDPSRHTLLFERFISAERHEPPDIDVDFEHQRREEVIQHLYRTYGRQRAALTGVVISYRSRSALRDVGRALGLDLERIEAVSRQQSWADGGGLSPEVLRGQGFDPDAPLTRLWVELTTQLRGFPRHLSQHPGGFVIAADDVSRLVPVENAAMDGRTVIQWDKDDLDALGLIKVDVLALGMLSAIRRALAWLALKEPGHWPLQRWGDDEAHASIPMSALPGHDPAVFDMLCAADSVGVFQVESRAQMSMLPRLRPRCFYDLVIEVAIVRPGPIQGGMVHPYLKRRSGEEPVSYPSEEARAALERTMGVPIFQEQVMQLAILAADFTPGEADQLRRAMAAWKRKGGLGPFHERLVGRMVAKGYEPDYAESVFRQIQGFGEYGFPESHAASFALLVWVSAWLKHHHPDAFLAALLDSQPMGFYAPAQLVRDAREHGVEVRPVCVLASEAGCTLESPGPEPRLWPVRLGLNRIGGLGEAAARRIVAARAERRFDSVEDLARRAELDGRALQALAEADALVHLAGHRRQAAWAVAGIDIRAGALLAPARTAEPEPAQLPVPSVGESLLADYRRTGLSLAAHPLALLRPALAAFRVLPAAELARCRPGQLARASGLVTHRQRPETAKGVVFVSLEDETGGVNVIVWPQVAQAQRQPLLSARLLTVYGVWQQEAGVGHLIARRLVDHSELLHGLNTRSRDFR
jgi:error-prone DNA polymerase